MSIQSLRRAVVAALLIVTSWLAVPTVARAEPVSILAAIGAFLDIRSLWKEFKDEKEFEQHKAAIQGKLGELEQSLQSVDRRMAGEIKSIREDLANRVTSEDFRKGLNEMEGRFNAQLAQMTVRVDRLDNLTEQQRQELDKAKARIAKLEQRYEFLPPTRISPLLREMTTGAPGSTPLIAEWIGLLGRSETNRIRLARSQDQFQDSAPLSAALDEEKQRLIREAASFRAKVVAEVKALRAERDAKLALYVKENHPEILKIDEKLLAVEWVLPLSLPEQEGPEKGRMPIVPSVFLGKYASELVAVHLDHGGTVDDLVPIFHQLVFIEADKNPRLQDPSGTVLRGVPFKGFDAETSKIRDLLIDTGEYVLACRATNDLLSKVSPSAGPRDPEILKLRAQQKRQSALVADRSKKLQAALGDALRNYVNRLPRDRVSADNMQLFRQRYLCYLALVAQEVYVPADANEADLIAAWQTMSDSKRLDTLVSRLAELKAGRQFEPTPTPEVLAPIQRPVVRDPAVRAANVPEEVVRQKRAYEEILTKNLAAVLKAAGPNRAEAAAEQFDLAQKELRGDPPMLTVALRHLSYAIALEPEHRPFYELRASVYEKMNKKTYAELDRLAAASVPD